MKSTVLFFVALCLVAAGDNAEKEALKKEWAKLEGTWVVIAKEDNGMKADEDAVKELGSITIKDGKYTWSSGSGGIMVIDPTKKPKHVDYSIVDGQGMVHLYKGIYELDGDTFKDIYAPPGAERPKDFKTEGTDHVMMVHKREKKDN
jgi:uncharacterized protein (TIGR03067 family)